MQKYRIDGIYWFIKKDLHVKYAVPICPTHNLVMKPFGDPEEYSKNLICEECTRLHNIPRGFEAQQHYILNKIDSLDFRKMDILNLDDEAIPLASDKLSSKDNKYFVKAILTESKVGLRLVVYAGEKGKDEKTQIFIEPEIKRVSFDQKDLHPKSIFTELKATFDDGSSFSIKKK